MSHADQAGFPEDDPACPIDFPCDFPVKVIGRCEGPFLEDANAIVAKHYPGLQPTDITQRASKADHFIALTFTVHAKSKAELDALYRDLTACDSILMAL